MEAVIGKITTMLKSKLHGLKGKATEQGKRKVMKYKEKLPTEDQITEKLKSSGCSDADKKRLEAKYNKIKNLLNKIKGIVAGAAAACAGLAAILAMLNGLLKILDAIVKILNVILKILKIVIKIAKIVVKFLGGTGTGGLIDLLSRLIVKAEYTIGKWVQAVGRAKEFIKKMLKKYINPISKALAKAAAALAALLGIIEGLLMVLELLYMFMLSKCAISGGDNNSTADTNINGNGTAGDGSGNGNGNGSGGLGNGTKGDQLNSLFNMLQNSSPEEIIGRMALRGDDEYIRYIRDARFQTIGYERFNAAITSLDSTQGVDYPYSDISKNIAPETRIDAESRLPEFPDLVRGNSKNNILRRNLKENPDGPQPSDENIGSY
jgi:hypothetical protein|tara:strand:+ start:1859 stop:2992 length:1134 start_codon:yes stop_codon:yes gene_type:complete